ncbi:antitoxin [Ruania halotolerans]|uniref:antitoxin n=1 Tax=Ruania halotolerans TaxID=2897773 RepID=UPI001E640FF5|nr:antitoxin [Ruania halotolerans]UFU06066.1 antitoxin [Ruania halotolerans]
MGRFEDIKNKATEALRDEEKTDRGLDSAANFVNEKTSGQHADKVAKARDFLDDKLGDNDGRAQH